MAQNEKSEKGAMSMQDIAATLIQPSTPVDEAEVDELEVPTDGESDDAEAVADEPEAEASETEGEIQEGDEQPDDEPDGEDEPEYFDISDDDLITVVVDGEERELSIGELKKAHSLGGATEKRLQEATEMRKTAHAERTQMLEHLAEQERALTQALSDLDDSVFQSVISPPPADLRRTNPDQFLRHQEAYQADQKRIADAKEAVQKKLKSIQDQRAARLESYAKEASAFIMQEIPELADEKQAPAMVDRLADTARSYGYTDQEIQSALDPRMFMLVRDAMRYREMTDKNKERPNVTNLDGQNTRKVRRLRSGSSSTAKARARQVDKDRQKIVEQARKSGKPQDVAKTLLKPSSRG